MGSYLDEVLGPVNGPGIAPMGFGAPRRAHSYLDDVLGDPIDSEPKRSAWDSIIPPAEEFRPTGNAFADAAAKYIGDPIKRGAGIVGNALGQAIHAVVPDAVEQFPARVALSQTGRSDAWSMPSEEVPTLGAMYKDYGRGAEGKGFSAEEKNARGYLANVADETIGAGLDLLTPGNVAIMAATGGLGALAGRGLAAGATVGAARVGAVAGAGARGLSAGFATQMAPAALDKIEKASALGMEQGFTPEVAGAFTGALPESAFAYLAGKHALAPKPLPFQGPRAPKAADLAPGATPLDAEAAVVEQAKAAAVPDFAEDLAPPPPAERVNWTPEQEAGYRNEFNRERPPAPVPDRDFGDLTGEPVPTAMEVAPGLPALLGDPVTRVEGEVMPERLALPQPSLDSAPVEQAPRQLSLVEAKEVRLLTERAGKIPDAELPQRLRFYQQRKLPAAAEVVQAEIARRAAPEVQELAEPAGAAGAAETGRSGQERQEQQPQAHKFSSTQIDLPPEVARPVLDFAAKIPESDLAGEGLEQRPHVTVKYGLHTENAAEVRRILADEGPIEVKLGKTSTFPPSESSDGAAVLKIDVDSPDLHRLNAKIAAALETTDSHPTYQPHVTLGYLKPEAASKYAGDASLAGQSMTIDRLTFSSKSGETFVIPLGGKARGAPTEVPLQPPGRMEARAPRAEVPDATLEAEALGAVPGAIAALSQKSPQKAGGTLLPDGTVKRSGNQAHPGKVTYGLTGLPEAPREIARALKADADNPLYLRAVEAMKDQAALEMEGRALEMEGRRQGEQREGERRGPEQTVDAERRSDSVVDRRTPEERRAKIREDIPDASEAAVERIARLEERAEAAEQTATQDPVTGLRNRRGWDETLKTVNPERDHVVAVDLRGFKQINDAHGHKAGDDALGAVGRLLKQHLGEESARPGGDEFGAVLRGLDPAEATRRVEVFRADLAKLTVPVEMPGGKVVDIPGFQAHIGVARNAEAADLASNAARDRVGSGRAAQPAGSVPADGGPERGVAGRPGEGRPDPPQQLGEPKYSVRPAPGQRGFDAADDVALREQKKVEPPKQSSMFGQTALLGGVEARVTEGREASGALFTQDARAAEKADSGRQTSLPAASGPKQVAATVEARAEPPSPEKEGVADFGEKIGGARKDTARPTGQKGSARVGEKDERPTWQRKYRVFQDANAVLRQGDKAPWTVVKGDQIVYEGGRPASFATKAQAEAALALHEVAGNHRVYEETVDGKPYRGGEKTGKYGIFRKVTDRKFALVRGGFDSLDAANAHMAKNPTEIIEHKFAFPEKPWLDRIERAGKDRRSGKDVSTIAFRDTFGFRGGEFGNWNMGSDGQAALNHAYDALLDLADTLRIPPAALSLNGELAIAFGARGTGGKDSARAHYEPDKAVINLTKIKGAGSLAHEWFHAVDNYLGREGGTDNTPAGIERMPSAHGFRRDTATRPELKEAFEKVIKTMTAREDVRTIDADQTKKVSDRTTEATREKLDTLRKQMQVDQSRYSKRWKGPTEEDLVEWDAIVDRVMKGDPGQQIHIPGQQRMSVGRSTYSSIEDLNGIYKKATGRSFSTNEEHSSGREVYWAIQRMRDTSRRMEEASAGATEKRRVPTSYLHDAKDIDNLRASDYWSTPQEMGARAFEAFVHDKLKGGGERSDYLAHGVENRFYAGLDMKPYPDGAERVAINTAFQGLFDTIKTKETEKGTALFKAGEKDAKPGPAITAAAVRTALPSGRVTEAGGAFIVDLPGGRRIRVEPQGDIAYDADAFKSARPKGLSDAERIVGSWQPVDKGGIIRLAEGADMATLDHEVLHSAVKMALQPREVEAILDHYKLPRERAAQTEETAADGYARFAADLRKARAEYASGTIIQRLVWKVREFAQRLAHTFKPTWEGAFREVESGRAFERGAKTTEAGTKYATAPAEPPATPAPERRPLRPIPPTPEQRATYEAGKAEGGRASGKPPEETVNLDRASSDEDIRKLVSRVADARKESQGEARSYRSWEEAREKAVEAGLTEADFKRMVKEGAVSDHVIEAGRTLRTDAFKTVQEALRKLNDAAKDGKETGDLEATYESAINKAAGVLWSTTRAGAEAGRALAIHRKLAEGMTEQERLYRKIAKGRPGLSEDFARRVLATDVTDAAALAALIRAEFTPSKRSMAYEWWINGLLSGPPTHAANAIGNTLSQVTRIAEKVFAGGIDAARVAAFGGSRERFVGEALADIQGLREGLPKATRAFSEAWADDMVAFREEGKVEHAPKIPGKAGRIVRTPTRLLSAADMFAKALVSTREARSLAYRKARMEGKKDSADVSQRMAEILGDLPAHPDIAKGMKAEADYQTFTKALGKYGQMIMGARDADPTGFAKVVVPFFRTPLNIAKYTLERTPLNFIRLAKLAHEGKLQGGELSGEFAKATMGTAIGIGFAMMANEGLITGGGPSDRRENETKRATGWQPYSLHVGKEYYSIQRLEPFSSIAGFAADLIETKDEKTQGDLVNKILGSVAENLTNKTFLQGLENVFLVLSDPKRNASQWVKSLEGSVVPAIVGRAAQAVDPTYRETSAFDGSVIAARLPGVSKMLEPRRSGSGDPVQRTGNAVERFASPLTHSTEKGPEADLEREFLDADYVPSRPSKSITVPNSGGRKVELSDEEYKLFVEADRQTTEKLRQVVKNPAFKRMDPLRKKSFLRSAYQKAQERASRRVASLPSYRAKVAKARRAAPRQVTA